MISFLLFSFGYSQQDTLKYLKQFEVNKAQYIGKPFSGLLNDMTKIQPKAIWHNGPFNNKNIRTSSDLGFYDLSKGYEFGAVTLVIHWQDPISVTEVNYYKNKNKNNFTSEEKNFFGKRIIKDILVYR
ncbi:hypothetical protein QWZ06_11755 [Chryseobacterium tructae]|uniref:Uncharacterized protein n=1 Tax=Chryseobacterium tructae TaxID=1037380 RepID=A0ABV7XZI8_9FLAO|nr:hypothetical protein [Chryseobacterium tructae]MDN3692910.1 hypothetical protein [Chryseobacterium tructae]